MHLVASDPEVEAQLHRMVNFFLARGTC
jgi:hypothetical protein